MQIRTVVFEKNVKTAKLRRTLIRKDDVTETKASLKLSKSQFQQPFASLTTFFNNFLNNFMVVETDFYCLLA